MTTLINGHELDTSDLALQFEQYHKSGQRIEVLTRYGEVLRGYVGKSTGWKPVYLLMHNTRSVSSSALLRAEDKIIKTINRYRYR